MCVLLFWWYNYTDIYFTDISLDEKSYETYKNILIYKTSYKTSTGLKPFWIRFNEIDGYIMIHGGTFRYLVLVNYGLFDEIVYKIKYLISEKSGITGSINHDFYG